MAALLAIGECMMELTPLEENTYQRSFAGDTYNALVYAKRNAPELDALIFTAIGNDDISSVMESQWQKEGVSSDFTLKSDKDTIGIYAIATDASGERSFSYWRKNSAASNMMAIKSVNELLDSCPELDCAFFSGISLAILSEEDKAKLIEFIKGLKAKGTRIAFDPNYRPAMWNNKAHAIYWLEKAYSVSDIVLPGEEDHQAIFNHNGHAQIAAYCQAFKIKEVVIKCGVEGVFVYSDGKLSTHEPFKAAPVQVDSTAAGDSFAGTYLSQRVTNHDIESSLMQATKVAGQVVQHRGAIMPTALYNSVIN
ncbi:sugar kinase [Colwellia sp. E2M01]|uniref:sugar kinase n=1 Tax=Colwellia sp. E2M01 TaxID=2841561 RepID=UPI001C09E2CB|nr:sugar kinase [Colwellia sp. E2M01]MBU2872068.1 sugar kinase [Colwellia sp. E2M01]